MKPHTQRAYLFAYIYEMKIFIFYQFLNLNIFLHAIRLQMNDLRPLNNFRFPNYERITGLDFFFRYCMQVFMISFW